jgi:hypothetical protein
MFMFHKSQDTFGIFQILTTANMKMAAFWILRRGLVGVNQRFRGTYCLHHQGDKSKPETYRPMMEAVNTSETSVNYYNTRRTIT